MTQDDELINDERTNQQMDEQPIPNGGPSTDDEIATQVTEIEDRDTTHSSGRTLKHHASRITSTIPPWVLAILAIALVAVLVWGGTVYIPSRLRPPTPTITPTLTVTPKPTNTPTSIPSPTPLAPDAGPQPLILVADFQDRSQGGGGTTAEGVNAAEAIYQALIDQAAKGPPSQLRVERLSQVVDEDTVQSVGQAHNAAYVLWGTTRGPSITPHLQRIQASREYRDAADERKTSGGQRLSLSEPGTIEFCTLDLSDQATYLALFTLGVGAYSQQEDDQALEYLGDALAGAPESDECPAEHIALHVYLGNIHSFRADYDAALAGYSRALEFAPDAAPYAPCGPCPLWAAYSSRGNTYHAMDEYESALADYSHALELYPQDANTYYNRGSTYRAMEKYQEALADYSRALELDPNHARFYASRGLTYHSLGDYQAALVDYSRALELEPDSAATYLNRGGTYANMGNYAAALKDYDRSVELDPQDADAYYNRGTIHAITENYPLALADFGRALELRPDFAQVYGNRGLVYKALGQTDKAIADLERFLELSDNPQWRQMIEQQLLELRAGTTK